MTAAVHSPVAHPLLPLRILYNVGIFFRTFRAPVLPGGILLWLSVTLLLYLGGLPTPRFLSRDRLAAVRRGARAA